MRSNWQEFDQYMQDADALPMDDDWRTMETAPKDGTTIIICNADAEEPDPCTAHYRDGRWVCTTKEDWDQGAPEFREYAWHLPEPTHWMPRPAPPESSGGNDVRR